MQKLELNGQEVLALSMDIENIKSQLESISKLLNANITYCSNNLVDSESGESVLSTKIEKLEEKNSLCINSLLTNLSAIATFVDSQIKEYSASTEDAENAVNSLINLINEKILTTEPYGHKISASFKELMANMNKMIKDI